MLALDLAATVSIDQFDVADALPWQLTDARAVDVLYERDGLWLCPLDVAGALAGRGYAASGRVVLDVDGTTVAVDATPEGAEVTPLSDRPDLVLGRSELGSLLPGGVRATTLIRARRVAEGHPGAAAAVDRLFVVDPADVLARSERGFGMHHGDGTAEALADAAALDGWVAVDRGQVVGSHPFEVTMPGPRRLAAVGITWVSVAASHRRRGLAAELMARTHDSAREAGPLLATLTASEAGIYRRFGYGVASVRPTVRIDTRAARFDVDLADPGSCRYIALADAAPGHVVAARPRRCQAVDGRARGRRR